MIGEKTMDRNFGRGEREEDSIGPVVVSSSAFAQQPGPTLSRLPHSTGGDYLDLDGFVEVVVNSVDALKSEFSVQRLERKNIQHRMYELVNDLVMDGFNNMEEFAAQTLDMTTEAPRSALKQGVDRIYNKVQDNVDEHLNLWESICRDRYFNNFPPNNPLTISSSKKTTIDARKNCIKASFVEDVQEEVLDTELRSLRSQLVAAHREVAKMRRELNSLEKQLALRREVLNHAKSLDEGYDGAMLEEVIRSAYLLTDTILKASTSQEEPRLQTRMQELRNCLADQILEEQMSTLKLPYDLDVADTAMINLLG